MIKSMTGYGRSRKIVGSWDLTVEIKSVNHRFFEFSSRQPRAWGFMEEKLKAAVSEHVSRGKVDVFVTVYSSEEGALQVEINHDLARSYLNSIRALGTDLELEDNITLSGITRFNDIFAVRKQEDDESAVTAAVLEVLGEAMTMFTSMRADEGGRMRDDLLEHLGILEENLTFIEQTSPKAVDDYREKLYNRLRELLDDRQVDEARIVTEAAIFSEKTAVAEETVRLRSHIQQIRDILNSGGAVGRKLDFIIQELNREANTIGSKAQQLEITRHVVEMKSEIEKIREQVQNIE